MDKVIGLHTSFLLKLGEGTMKFIGGNLERKKKVKVFFVFFPFLIGFFFLL
jgi:hypothetical protein